MYEKYYEHQLWSKTGCNFIFEITGFADVKFSVPLKSLQTDKVPIRMWVPRNEHSLPDVVRLVPSSSLELAFYLYCSVLTQSLLSKKLHHSIDSFQLLIA